MGNLDKALHIANLEDGVQCGLHPNCLSHVTHPCEGCGRIAGSRKLTMGWQLSKRILSLEDRIKELEGAIENFLNAAIAKDEYPGKDVPREVHNNASRTFWKMHEVLTEKDND